jgi:hypothetical protein
MNTVSSTTASQESTAGSRLVRVLAEMRFFSFSLFIHTVLVVVLGTVVLFQSREAPPDFTATGSAGLMTDTSSLEPPPEMRPEEMPKDTPSTSSPATAQTTSLTMDAITTSATKSSFAVSTTSVKANLDGIGKGDASKMGKGLGLDGKGLGMGGSAMRFFGTKATGQNIVLVVDVSGSMVRGTKSPKSYAELEKEVIRVIKEMDMKSSFGLIVFSKDAKSFRSHMVRATTEDKERACNWLKKHNPSVIDDPKADEEERAFHHGTRADRGLEEAFTMGPDLIFFVSDGEPTGSKPDEVIAQVEAAQKNLPRPAAIHCIAFLADSCQRFMKNLAEKNNGLFREVNPRDLN